jgi:ABC-type Zn2+ transport system substrate-binding protein/surface adhesin
MQEKDTRWFFDRMDLLLQTECMTSLEEATAKNMPSYKPTISRLLDTSLPIEERWFRPHHHHEGHNHEHKHENKHEHKHDEGHTHQHHPHQEHKDLKDEIVGSSAVIDAITAQFGKQNLTMNKVPYFYQFLVFCG